MNKYMLLVMKWLNDKDSVSQKESVKIINLSVNAVTVPFSIAPLPKPIELEEKGLYLFDVGNKKELVGRAYHTAFEEGPMLTNLQTNTSYSVDCCTNIQQLFTKSELNKEEV